MIDSTFATSIDGIIMTFELIVSAIVLICVGTVSSPVGSNGGFIYFVCCTHLAFTIIIYASRLLQLVDEAVHTQRQWMLAKIGRRIIWSFFYFVAGIVAAVEASNNKGINQANHAGYAAASFFCFVHVVVILEGLYVYYQAFQHGVGNMAGQTFPTSGPSSGYSGQVFSRGPPPAPAHSQPQQNNPYQS